MIRLITSHYKDSHIERQKEINLCLELNINNKYIDEIILLCEESPPFKNKKIKLYKSARPKIYDFLSIMQIFFVVKKNREKTHDTS